MSIGIWQIAIVVILVVLLFGRGKISSLMGDVAKVIKSSTKKEIDRRDITVPDIHSLGSYSVSIKLHPEVSAEVNIEVIS